MIFGPSHDGVWFRVVANRLELQWVSGLVVRSFWVYTHNLHWRRFERQNSENIKEMNLNIKSTHYSLFVEPGPYHMKNIMCSPSPNIMCSPSPCRCLCMWSLYLPKSYLLYLLQHKAMLPQPFSMTHRLLVSHNITHNCNHLLPWCKQAKVGWFFLVVKK